MSDPKVSVVMLLSPGREEMAARAVRAVGTQTYLNIELVAFETEQHVGRTIGYLRNIANACATGDLIAHADDDDWMHPRRVEEQVALLQASGKQCVGYRELLFWDTRCPEPQPVKCPTANHPIFVRESGRIVEHYDQYEYHSTCPMSGKSYGEAWLYRNDDPRWCAGGSMLYTREMWQRCPFDDAPHEDQRWWLNNAEKCVGVTSLPPEMHGVNMPEGYWKPVSSSTCKEPRMIAQIHALGTEQIPREVMLRGGGGVWKRTAEFDSYCQEKMRP